MSVQSDNKRIAKNTLALYLRMIFILCVGLFTSRVVLNALGIEDYGIYNVVGGFVTMFTFLNGAMATATQRFITFDLANGSIERQQITFSTALIIHFILAGIILLLAETVGLWFVINKLVVPDGRFTAAMVVYQVSILSCCVSIISLPYNASIIAHEKMSAFAYISIMDVSLKLLVVYLLLVVEGDRLIYYAILLLLIQLLDRLIYGLYCAKHFPETKFKFVWDKHLIKEINNIAGWSLLGNLAGVGYTQGLNVLLNMFFGPTVNAARGIAITVQGVVTGFVANFQMALNPQITKTYATNDLNRMHQLIYASSKYSFFMLFLIVLPIIIEAQQILNIWLGVVPNHAVWFLRLTLCIMLIEALANPLMVSSQATGKVKVYQIVVGGILLLIVPMAYLVLKLGGIPESVFIIHLLVAMIAQAFRLIIIAKLIAMSIAEYLRKVILPILLVFSLANIIPWTLFYHLPDTWLSLLSISILSIINTLIIIVYVGLSSTERQKVMGKVSNIIKTKLRKC